MVSRIAIAKTGWSDWYQGGSIVGRHSYLNAEKAGQKGHECYNFKPAPDGTYYGYLPPIGGGGRPPQPRAKTDWLVIFISAYEGKGPLTFVGWYERATFSDEYTERPEYQLSAPFETDAWGKRFLYCVRSKQAYLVRPEKRTETIPGNHLGKASIIYVRDRGLTEPWREELARCSEKLVAKFKPIVEEDTASITDTRGFPEASAEHRKRVEEAAEERAKRYLRQQGYTVEVRTADKCGYDLFAIRKRDSSELHVEVKGTSLVGESFFISQNEYLYMDDPRWRLALVTNSLDRDRAKLCLLNVRQVRQRFIFKPMTWRAAAKRL